MSALEYESFLPFGVAQVNLQNILTLYMKHNALNPQNCYEIASCLKTDKKHLGK